MYFLELPHQVWLEVAAFIPTQALINLYSVNSSFFYIALEARYRRVSLVYWDYRLVRNLVRLKDPFIARLVKVIFMHPRFLKDVTSDKNQERTPMGKLWKRFKTAQDVMQAVLDALNCLPSLTEYFISWHGLLIPPPLTPLATSCTTALFASPSLTQLSLDISLENIDALCSASSHVPPLEQFNLHLYTDNESSTRSSPSFAELARFISNLSPTLQALSIGSHQPMDISELFSGLSVLEKLAGLTLVFPRHEPHLGDPEKLDQFLRNQGNTIKCLRISIRQHNPGDSDEWGEAGSTRSWSLHPWMSTVLGDGPDGLKTENYFKELQTLEVSSSLMPFESVLHCATKFGSVVGILKIMGGEKSFEKVEKIVKGLVYSPRPPSRLVGVYTPTLENLHTLQIGFVSFCPELLDLLATNLVRLQHLKLLVRYFLPSRDHIPRFTSRMSDGCDNQREDQLYELLETLQDNWVWPRWGLRTIAVHSKLVTMRKPMPLPLASVQKSQLSDSPLTSCDTPAVTSRPTSSVSNQASIHKHSTSFRKKWTWFRLKKKEQFKEGETKEEHVSVLKENEGNLITMEAALAEVLKDCLPGVKFVR